MAIEVLQLSNKESQTTLYRYDPTQNEAFIKAVPSMFHHCLKINVDGIVEFKPSACPIVGDGRVVFKPGHYITFYYDEDDWWTPYQYSAEQIKQRFFVPSHAADMIFNDPDLLEGEKIILQDFIRQMIHELKSNRDKGDWRSFLSKPDIFGELLHHTNKLHKALLENKDQEMLEFSADTANCALFMFHAVKHLQNHATNETVSKGD